MYYITLEVVIVVVGVAVPIVVACSCVLPYILVMMVDIIITLINILEKWAAWTSTRLWIVASSRIGTWLWFVASIGSTWTVTRIWVWWIWWNLWIKVHFCKLMFVKVVTKTIFFRFSPNIFIFYQLRHLIKVKINKKKVDDSTEFY